MEAVKHVCLPFAAISGYVTVIYDGLCWLGYVVGVEESDHVVTVKFLHPCIPAASFVFPDLGYSRHNFDPCKPNNSYRSNICLK